jgi:hypothetical protein
MADRDTIFSKPLSLNKKFMAAQSRTVKVNNDTFKDHPLM